MESEFARKNGTLGYFFNAVYYCLSLWWFKMGRMLMHWILCLVLFLFKYVLPFERFQKLKVYFVNNIK